MITFDGIIFSSGNRHGGVSVYFRELLRHAALAGEQFEVVVHDPTISALQLNCSPENLLFRAPRVLERVRSVKNVPLGVFHSSYYRSTSSSRIKNVVTVYDFTYEKHAKGAKAVFHKIQKRAAIMRADAAICISENTKRDLIEFVPRYPSERIFVTHLAASEQFRPLEDGSVTTLSEKPFVLFVGSRPGYKNFEAAVRSVGLIRSLTLVCAGGGSFSRDERTLLEDVLPDRHFHAGPVSTEGLNELYNAAVCLLYPSLYEGFGIPPLEAMQAGCPFVALNRSSIPEVAGDAGILVTDADPHSLANAINQCVSSTRRSELRARGFARAANFSWRQTYLQTSLIYRAFF